MIYISKIPNPPVDCKDGLRWTVTWSNPDGSLDTFKCRTCELAVEFALLCSAQRKFVGNPDHQIKAEGAAAKRLRPALAAET